MLWKVRWTFVSRANNSVGTQSCATPPGRSAGLPDPTRSSYVRVLDSTGECLDGISPVRASARTLKRLYLQLLGEYKELVFYRPNNSVGTQSCPTSPGRSAGRPEMTGPWYVRFLDSTSLQSRPLPGELLFRYIPTLICLCKPFSCKACPGETAHMGAFAFVGSDGYTALR